ncbi:hypothetical protein WAI453_013051 [Rhynchosporium graminicola]
MSTQPLYADLRSEDSFESTSAGDEEKLFTDVDLALEFRSRSISQKFGNVHNPPKDRELPKYSRGFVTAAPIVIHLALIFFYTAVSLLVIYRRGEGYSPVIYTPAQEAIQREAQVLSVKINQTSSKFNADPSTEVDDAWASLFRYANIRITKEEVEKLGRPSIQLSDGSGDYFGTLDVYHQLHCLKYIRQYVHQDYYTVKDTNVPVKDHVNHCIEMLRQVIMCKADTAMMTYEWLPDFPGPWPNFGIQHECVNWEKIDHWSRERSIDIFDPKFFRHPKFGDPYGKKEGNMADHLV